MHEKDTRFCVRVPDSKKGKWAGTAVAMAAAYMRCNSDIIIREWRRKHDCIVILYFVSNNKISLSIEKVMMMMLLVRERLWYAILS